MWEFFKSLPALLADCQRLLGKKPLFVVLTAYGVSISSLGLYNLLDGMFSTLDGAIESGELALTDCSAGRLLHTSVFARWSGSISI